MKSNGSAAEQAAEIEYEKILAYLESSADKPAKPGRFEIFETAVTAYRVEAKTSWPSQDSVIGRDVFLIAGTNGKGTVAKTLETLLAASGERVGLFTSPHIMDTTERIRLGGSDLTHAEFVAVYKTIEPFAKKFELSHFEILTLMMIEAFFGDRIRPKVTCAVIEVGVGGRLDPTRVIPHEYAVITRIGLDHEAILGPLASIAREKFAITDGARIAIYAPPDENVVASAVFEAQAKQRLSGAPTQFLEVEPYAHHVSGLPTAPVWSIHTPYGKAALSLLGERAVFNTSIALQTFEASGRNVASVLGALKKVNWPARMELLNFHGRDIYLSGDHNPQGVKSLESLLHHFDYEKLWLVVGIGKNKDVDSMLKLFAAIPRVELFLTLTPFRALKLEDYGPWLETARGADVEPIEALSRAIELAGPNDLVVVSGSLYLVGDLRLKIISA